MGGLGVIGDALFIHDGPHLACDLVAFNSSLCVLFLFAWRFRRDPRWRGLDRILHPHCGRDDGAALWVWIANHLGGPAGLLEKLATTLRAVWSVLLVTRLLGGASACAARQVLFGRTHLIDLGILPAFERTAGVRSILLNGKQRGCDGSLLQKTFPDA